MPAIDLITFEYFGAGDLSLANVATFKSPYIPGPAMDRLNKFIAVKQPECLLEIFGFPFYKLLTTEVSQRMTDIISGVEYTVKDILYKWDGLIQQALKLSLIANYVYFEFQTANSAQTTATSTGFMKTEAGKSISPDQKMATSEKFYRSQVESLLFFLCNQKDVNGVRIYPEFTYKQLCISQRLTGTSCCSTSTNIYGF